MNGTQALRRVLGVQAPRKHSVMPCWSGFYCRYMQKKAHAAFLQLTKDKMIALQYADAFETCLDQLKDYDESFYLTKFIFCLCAAILSEVFV